LDIFDEILNYDPDIFEAVERSKIDLIKTMVEHCEKELTKEKSSSFHDSHHSLFTTTSYPLTNPLSSHSNQQKSKYNDRVTKTAVNTLLNKCDKFGRTPLIYAIVIGNLSLVKYTSHLSSLFPNRFLVV
jgi:hypothetical protein